MGSCRLERVCWRGDFPSISQGIQTNADLIFKIPTGFPFYFAFGIFLLCFYIGPNYPFSWEGVKVAPNWGPIFTIKFSPGKYLVEGVGV
jgi:hypothetical protein